MNMKNKMNSSALKKYSYQESNSKKPFKRKGKQHAIKANSFAVDNNHRAEIFDMDDSDKNLHNATSIKGDKCSTLKDFSKADRMMHENAF